MTTVQKQWGNQIVSIQQERLDQAKKLIWEHGISVSGFIAAVEILEREMSRQPDDEEIDRLVTIAVGEVMEQRKGYLRAIADLREAAEAANAPGPEHSLDRWATYLASASYLEGRVK